MTKRKYIKRAMQMRPTAREWRELVKRVVNYNNMIDYRNAEDSFRDLHPLVGAIHEHYAKWHIEGAADPKIRRDCRRAANRYHAII